MVCSLHSVTTGSRDRANVSLIIIINNNVGDTFFLFYVDSVVRNDSMARKKTHLLDTRNRT